MRHIWLSVALLCAACTTAESPRHLELKPYVGRLVTLEREADGQMLFDSGGGVTALIPEIAKMQGCTPFGRLAAFRMNGEPVTFERCGRGVVRLDDVVVESEIYVFDLMALLPEDWPPLDGIVSLASFANTPITIDLAAGALILETPSTLKARINSAQEGAIRVVRGPGSETTAFIKIEGKIGDLWFLLDSANLDNVLIAPHAAAQLGIEAGDETFESTFDISGAGAQRVRARKADIIYDGALNEAFMRRFAITIDIENEKIWFAPSASPSRSQ